MTDKDIKSLFEELNPDDIQKQKAFESIMKKAEKNKPAKASFKKVLLIAAIISTTAVISAFGINALSGGGFFDNIGKVFLGGTTASKVKAETYAPDKTTESSSESSYVKTRTPIDIKKIKKIEKRERVVENARRADASTEPIEIQAVTNPPAEPTAKLPDKEIIPRTAPANTQAATINKNEVIKGDYIYLPLSDKTANIAEYHGNEERVIIPSEIDGYRIVGIDEYAFTCNRVITEAVIPEGVKTLNKGAFYACKNLTSISLPDTLINIGDSAFRSSGLRSVVIPDSVKSVGRNAFTNCQYLTSATFGKGIKSIEKNCFGKALKKITGYENTAAQSYAEQNGIEFISLIGTAETTAAQAQTTSEPAVEPDSETAEFCDILNDYIEKIGAAYKVPAFNAYNLSKIKFYINKDNLKFFHIDADNFSDNAENIYGYVFKSYSTLSEQYNKCGYCVYHDKKIYSLKDAVSEKIIDVYEASELTKSAPSEKVLENCVFFNADAWGESGEVYCHIFEKGGDYFLPWQGKYERCSKAVNGLYYYDLSKLKNSENISGRTLKSGRPYIIMFCDSSGKTTCECTFGIECINDTLILTGKTLENPLDCEKLQYEAQWTKNASSYGARFNITSTGNITGRYLCAGENPKEIIGEWLSNFYLSELFNPVDTLVKVYGIFSIDSKKDVEDIYNYTTERLNEYYLELYSVKINQILYKAYDKYTAKKITSRRNR